MLQFNKLKKKTKKNIAQNFRNWFLNQNYHFNIKFIAKKIIKQLIALILINKIAFNQKNRILSLKNLSKDNIQILISLFDKSLKKNVYHKNAINRKKSKLTNIIKFLIN